MMQPGELAQLSYFGIIGTGLICLALYFSGVGFFGQRRWPNGLVLMVLFLFALVIYIVSWGKEAEGVLALGDWISAGAAFTPIKLSLVYDGLTSIKVLSATSLVLFLCVYFQWTEQNTRFPLSTFFMHAAVSVSALVLAMLAGTAWTFYLLFGVILLVGFVDRAATQSGSRRDFFPVAGFIINISATLFWAFKQNTGTVFIEGQREINSLVIGAWFLSILFSIVGAPRRAPAPDGATPENVSLLRGLLFSQVFPAWGFLLLMSRLSQRLVPTETLRTALALTGVVAIIWMFFSAVISLNPKDASERIGRISFILSLLVILFVDAGLGFALALQWGVAVVVLSVVVNAVVERSQSDQQGVPATFIFWAVALLVFGLPGFELFRLVSLILQQAPDAQTLSIIIFSLILLEILAWRLIWAVFTKTKSIKISRAIIPLLGALVFLSGSFFWTGELIGVKLGFENRLLEGYLTLWVPHREGGGIISTETAATVGVGLSLISVLVSFLMRKKWKEIAQKTKRALDSTAKIFSHREIGQGAVGLFLNLGQKGAEYFALFFEQRVGSVFLVGAGLSRKVILILGKKSEDLFVRLTQVGEKAVFAFHAESTQRTLFVGIILIFCGLIHLLIH